MGMVTEFMAYITDIIRIGFGPRKDSKSSTNQAVSFNRLNAVIGTFPDFEISYPLMSVSQGKLTRVKELTVAALASAKLKFTWFIDMYTSIQGSPTDDLIVLVYNPALHEFGRSVRDAKRSAGTFTMQLPQDFSGADVHCYLFFVSATGAVSNSVHMEVTVL